MAEQWLGPSLGPSLGPPLGPDRAAPLAPPYPVDITNEVITVEFGLEQQFVSLPRLAQMTNRFYHKPKNFAATNIRLKNPRATILLFPSGSGVITGAKSLVTALIAARQFCGGILNHYGYIEAAVGDYVIQNIVSACYCGFRVDLVKVQRLMSKNNCTVNYNQAQFPAAIFRRTKDNGHTIVWLIFYSGKIIMTGGQNEEDRYVDMAWLHYEVLVHCKQTDEASMLKNHAECRRDVTFRELNSTTQNIADIFAADVDQYAPMAHTILSSLVPELEDDEPDAAEAASGSSIVDVSDGLGVFEALMSKDGKVYDGNAFADNLVKVLGMRASVKRAR